MIAQPAQPAKTCTAAQYAASQRQAAEASAPAGPVSEADFRRRLAAYPLPVIRMAATRYGSARGRSYTKVIDRFAANMRNPHVNRGDDYRIALGHVEATRSMMQRLGWI